MVTFTTKETLPARELRKISQTNLLELVNEREKIGVIVNDEIALVLLKVEMLEQLVDRVRELEEIIERSGDLEYEKSISNRLTLNTHDWTSVPNGMNFTDWLEQGDSE